MSPGGTTIAPWLAVDDGAQAVAFYAEAFGAEEAYRLEEDGHVLVARLTVGGAPFWISEDADAAAGASRSAVRMIVTLDDPDEAFERAVAAGATEVAPVADEHGWRTGRLTDLFGYDWELARQLDGD